MVPQAKKRYYTNYSLESRSIHSIWVHPLMVVCNLSVKVERSRGARYYWPYFYLCLILVYFPSILWSVLIRISYCCPVWIRLIGNLFENRYKEVNVYKHHILSFHLVDITLSWFSHVRHINHEIFLASFHNFTLIAPHCQLEEISCLP